MFSKIDMDAHKNLFAKTNLTTSVRFITAAKITAKKFCNGNNNMSAILFAIMGDFDSANKLMTGYQRNAVADIAFSEDKCHQLREFFLDIYNDDDVLLDFLNTKITERSISLNRSKKGRNKEEVIDFSKQIINDDLLANLDLNF